MKVHQNWYNFISLVVQNISWEHSSTRIKALWKAIIGILLVDSYNNVVHAYMYVWWNYGTFKQKNLLTFYLPCVTQIKSLFEEVFIKNSLGGNIFSCKKWYQQVKLSLRKGHWVCNFVNPIWKWQEATTTWIARCIFHICLKPYNTIYIQPIWLSSIQESTLLAPSPNIFIGIIVYLTVSLKRAYHFQHMAPITHLFEK